MINPWQKHGMVFLPVEKDDHHQGHQDNVFIKSLPVGQFHGITETAAIGYRVINGIIQGENGEKGHHQQQGPDRYFSRKLNNNATPGVNSTAQRKMERKRESGIAQSVPNAMK